MLLDERDNEQLCLIIRYVEKIDGYLKKYSDDENLFIEDNDFHDLCSFALVQLGEAVNRLSDEFMHRHQEVDWYSIHGLRCYLVHGYKNINYKIVWDTIKMDVPLLAAFCRQHIEEDVL